jgi:sugar lactone lactonase YvrE
MATPSAGGAVQQDNVSMRTISGLGPADVLRRAFTLPTVQGSRKPEKGFVDTVALAKQPTKIAVSVGGNVVNIYDRAGNQLAQLTGFSGADGLASDTKGDLYVGDSLNQRVQIYGPGFQGPPKTLSTPGYYPNDVASFENGKIVAACNQKAGSLGTNVEFFTNGQLTNTISNPNVPIIYYCAFDAVGNLYIGMFGPKFLARVGEIVGGAQGNTLSFLTTSNKLYSPTGIQVTTDGHIAVGDSSGCAETCYKYNAVYTYSPPVGGSLGSPVSKTVLKGAAYPDSFAFTRNMASLYTADSFNNEAEEYAYPAGGTIRSTINVDSPPYGIAVIPSQ